MESNNRYVYAYLDPRKPGNFIYGFYTFEFEPIYIGKGTRDRDKVHLTKENKNPFRFAKIKNIIAETGNNPIIIHIQKNLTDTEAFKIEKELISLIGRKDNGTGCLTNLTEGGEGYGHWNKGKSWTKNQRILLTKIREENPPRKGMTNSPQMRKKQSDAKLGKTFSIEHKENLAKKKSQVVYAYKDNVLVNEYENVLKLAEELKMCWSTLYPKVRKNKEINGITYTRIKNG